MLPLLVTIAVIGAIILLFAGMYYVIGPDQDVEERLFHEQMAHGAERESGSALSDKVDSQLKKRAFGSKLAAELVQADSQMTVVEFLLMNTGLVIAALLLGVLFGGTIFAGVGVAVLAGMGPRAWLRRRKAARRTQFGNQLPDVLGLIVGSLRAGYGLVQAMKLVAQEMPEPSKTEYGRVVNEISLGYSLSESLEHLIERMESDDLMMVVTAINIQNEVGGNLGNILDTIAETIRERVKLQGEVRTMTSMQRATGYMLAVMPFIIGAVLLLISPEYISQMFVFPWYAIPIGAVFSMAMGIVLMNRITKLEF